VRDSAAAMVDLFNAIYAWGVNADGTATTDVKDWLGVGAGSGGGANGLAAPGSVSATNNLLTGVSVSWNSVPTATGYTVWRGTSSTTLSQLATSLAVSPYLDTSAVVGTHYFYAVSASTSVLNSDQSTPPVEGWAVASSLTPVTTTETTPYVMVVPAGAGHMTIEAWGPGGSGGHYPAGHGIGDAITYPYSPQFGGGGASGGYMKVSNIVVLPGEVYVLYPGVAGGITAVYKTAIGNAVSVIVNSGGAGGDSTTHRAGAAGRHATTVGASTFVGATIDTTTPGIDGTAGTLGSLIAGSDPAVPAYGPNGTGGIGGAPIVVGGNSAGGGGAGADWVPVIAGDSGMIRITFQA